MIFEFIQKTSYPLRTHEVLIDGVANAKAATAHLGQGVLNVGNDKYELSFEGLRSVNVTQNGSSFCTITPKLCVTKKVLFIKTGYEYYEISTLEGFFTVYESGLGFNQHFYSLYRDGGVTAVIHKPDRVENFLDTYLCYLEDDSLFTVVCLYCLFLECAQYFDVDSFDNGINDTQTITAQQELKDKYDPSFIPRIKAKHGITD